MDVLALSTLEHVGYGDYIPSTPEESPRSAFEKIANESRRYLLTVPYGFNPDSDAFFFGEDIPTARYMIREPLSNTWRQVRTAAEAQRPYGARGVFAPNAWANGLAIIERSSVR
jgi:hypothetical protein